jgi:hypothetical protein
MSGEGVDTGERVDVGSGPGQDLDLTIPAGQAIDITFDWLVTEGEEGTDPTLQGITPQALPPHLVVGFGGNAARVNVPWRASNLIIDNPNLANSIFYVINEGLITELNPEDSISFDKRQIYSLVITGTAADRVVIHTW